MEYIQKIEAQNYEEILEICKHNGTNFKDDIFPPTRKSLTYDE